jgi:hypothetical protein
MLRLRYFTIRTDSYIADSSALWRDVWHRLVHGHRVQFGVLRAERIGGRVSCGVDHCLKAVNKLFTTAQLSMGCRHQ